ncbi:MAG: hypothetical protein KTR31_38980, partial [Myxococcales bacterium]|nr:hypothetical protein [Myxococcales bacterium]
SDGDLRPGDVVRSVDGQDVAGMSRHDFLRRSLGDEGTELELVLETADGERQALMLLRERLAER